MTDTSVPDPVPESDAERARIAQLAAEAARYRDACAASTGSAEKVRVRMIVAIADDPAIAPVLAAIRVVAGSAEPLPTIHPDAGHA